MGKFAVGDQVVVTTDRFGDVSFCGRNYPQKGLTGIVTKTDRQQPTTLPLQIKYDEFGTLNAYAEYDLEFIDRIAFMVEPEFSLDEMADAQDIISQMG